MGDETLLLFRSPSDLVGDIGANALLQLAHDDNLPTGGGFSTTAVSLFCASYATHGAGVMVFVNVMRIPCFGRRMTIGRASIVCPGAN